MVTIDATDPDTLLLVGDINTSNTVSNFAGNSVAVTGSGFGVASHLRFDNGSVSESRLTVFDARDPADNENQVSEFRFAGQTKDIEIAAGEAFVATGTEGLQIVRFLGIDTQGAAPDIAVTTLPDDVDDAVAGRQVFQGQTVRFDVATNDDLQVRSVDVLINGNVVLSTVSYPWDLTVTLPTIADLGTDQLNVQFRATDTGGNATVTDSIAIQMVADVTPFEVLSISPDDGAALLPGAVRSVTVTFSKSVESDTVNADTFALFGPSGTIVPASISVRNSGTQVQLTYPADAFEAGAYALTIDADNVTDRAGTALQATDIVSDFSVQIVSGQTWISATDGTWNDPVNWANGQIPDAGADVVVPLLDGVTATVSTLAADANSINISGGGKLEVRSDEDGTELTTAILSNIGNFEIARGEVAVNAQTANSGNLTVSSARGAANNGQMVTFGGELSLTGTLANTGVIEARDGGEILLATPVIDNQGEIRVTVSDDANAGSSRIKTSGALTELTGGGTLRFDVSEGSTRSASFGGGVSTANQGIIDESFVNVDNLITGTGKIGAGFEFENAAAGRITAQDGDFLQITAGRLDNDGVISAQDGGTLLFKSEQFYYFGGLFGFLGATDIDNTDGIIRADGGAINLGDSSVSGGVLETLNGGTMFIGSITGNNFPMLRNVTVEGQLIITDYLQTGGIIDNKGFLSTSIGDSGSYISISEDTVLSGGGSLNLFSTDLGDVDNEAVAQIVNEYEVQYDDETGDPLVDQYGQLILAYETTLVLNDHGINGSGRIGWVDDGAEFGGQPLFRITLEAGSEVFADQPGAILEFINTEVTVRDSTLASNGGILRMIDTDVFNFSDVNVQQGGELRLERSFDPTSMGGYFYNEGNINVFDGSFNAGVSVYNRGSINVVGGTAEVERLTDDAAAGGRTFVGDAFLTIAVGGETQLDTSRGDAEVVIENTADLSATLFEFEVGDTLHLVDLDDSAPIGVGFVGAGLTGVLTLNDGLTSIDLQLSTSIGDFTGVTAADFEVTSSSFGGIQLETILDFV